jgi:hypothetical protein
MKTKKGESQIAEQSLLFWNFKNWKGSDKLGMVRIKLTVKQLLRFFQCQFIEIINNEIGLV